MPDARRELLHHVIRRQQSRRKAIWNLKAKAASDLESRPGALPRRLSGRPKERPRPRGLLLFVLVVAVGAGAQSGHRGQDGAGALTEAGQLRRLA